MRKGQIDIVILLALGLIVVIGGTVYTGISIKESEKQITDESLLNKYVGDLNTKLIYDKNKCDIPSTNLVEFKSLEQAYSLGFKDAPNCV